jgi:hypothetical protein
VDSDCSVGAFVEWRMLPYMVRECGRFGCFFGRSGPFQQERVIGVGREIRLPGTWITASRASVDP